MKQLNNGFKACYYLTTDGNIYNKETNKIIKADSSHRFKLKLESGIRKSISLKELYYLVYNTIYCIDNIEDLQSEEWKPIERTNKIYWISNKGRVKSLQGYEAKILKENRITGYARVDIIQDNSRSTKLISRLVASAFLPQPQSIDMQIHHIDGNTFNNNSNNLKWVTPQEHIKIHLHQKKKELKINE